MNFTKALSIDNITECGWQLETLNHKPQLLKESFTRIVTNYDRVKSTNNTRIIVNELTDMYNTARADEIAKSRILDEAEFSCSIFLGSSYFPVSTYLSLLILTFPIIREVMKALPAFNGNFFTPDILIDNVEFPDSVDSTETKRSCIYNVLKTLTELGAVKKLKKGMYKKGTIPLIDAQGLESALLTASELGNGKVIEADLYLRPYSFEITKEFTAFYGSIDYSAIVPNEIWNKFLNSDEGFTLQFNEGQWTVSDKPFLYQPLNLPLSSFNRRNYFTVEDIKAAKMRQLAIKGDNGGSTGVQC